MCIHLQSCHVLFSSHQQAEIVEVSEEEKEEEEEQEDVEMREPVVRVRDSGVEENGRAVEVRASHRLAESDSESEGEVDEEELAMRRHNLRQKALLKVQQEEEVNLLSYFHILYRLYVTL